MAQKWTESIAFRLFSIGFLIIILTIPTLFIKGLVNERSYRRDQVVRDVAMQWSGGEQQLVGPILSIPYRRFFKDEKGMTHETISYSHFLPSVLSVNGELSPEERYRGIFKVALYDCQLNIMGTFVTPNIKDLNINPAHVMWQDAVLIISTGGVKGIKDQVQLKWNQKTYVAESGVINQDVVSSGVSIRLPLNQKKQINKFSFQLNLKGNEKLTIAPIGKVTEVKLSSSWADPSFVGEFLPTTRSISDQGFKATWKVMDINRNYPQQWIGSRVEMNWSWFGIALYQPIDHYQKIERLIKYALMFIVLTFLAFFVIEVLKRHQLKFVHPIQYLMIGCALILFYALLLSLSEHLGFLWSYLLASLVIVGLITSYARVVLNQRLSWGVGGLLVTLYAYLYIVLQLEDYALLIGTLGLLGALGLTMYLTRKIDWYGLQQQKES